MKDTRKSPEAREIKRNLTFGQWLNRLPKGRFTPPTTGS